MSAILEKIISYSNLQEAFGRVKANAGCRGSDGVSLQRFELNIEHNLRDLSNRIAKGSYHPFPLMRFPIPKKSGGQRFLSVPTVRDRVAQAGVFLATKDIFEAEFENISHGYREGRGVRTAVFDIESWRDKGFRFAVDADIDSYFDSVSHDLLIKKLAALFPGESRLLKLFEKWIRAEVYDGDRIWTLQKGIPQGAVVSPVLANLFLDELDETLMSFGLKLVRYADDFLILTKTQSQAEEAIEITDLALEDMQLDLNPLKTKIVSFDRGFKFLGAIFLYDGTYLPFPKKRDKQAKPTLPPVLSLLQYLELRNRE
ncbi:RNA-directed DNA polymerase [candidate division KSB1 bacterium]|nr:RNA-directed DNA polymerase [candidate division KSB1 bacterium]